MKRFTVRFPNPQVLAILFVILSTLIGVIAFRGNYAAMFLLFMVSTVIGVTIIGVALVARENNSLVERMRKLEKSLSGFIVGEKNQIS